VNTYINNEQENDERNKTPNWVKDMRTIPKELENISPNDSEMTTSSQSGYVEFCEKNGLIQTDTELSKQVQMIIDSYVWKTYKLPDYEDYQYGSAFCNKILQRMNCDVACMNRRAQEMWSRIMPLVKGEYQITRSSVTQAMKQVFLGKQIFIFN
jgi:hypothetical protein